MAKFEKITQQVYDRFKLYLISHFNVVFEEGEESNIVEMFKISTKGETMLGTYRSDETVEVNSKNDKIFSEVYEKLAEISGNSQQNNENEMDKFLKNAEMFYAHISKCDSCKKKLVAIWSHLGLGM